jgi:gp16 family phage-associated protein
MEEKMDIDQRNAAVNQKLESIGETIVSWSKKNGLDHRLVSDLINGKFLGTRGITLNARMKIEEFFGNIFDK